MGPSQVGRLELHSVWSWKPWVLPRPLRSSLAQWHVRKTSLPKTKPQQPPSPQESVGPSHPTLTMPPDPPTATLILLLGSAWNFSKIGTLIPFPEGSWFLSTCPLFRDSILQEPQPPDSLSATSGPPREAASRGTPCCPLSGPTSQWECQTLLPSCWFSSPVSCEFPEG